MPKLRTLAVAIVVLVLLVVVLQNTQDATVRLLIVKVTMPLALLLGVILAGGFICGIGAALIMGRTGGPAAKP